MNVRDHGAEPVWSVLWQAIIAPGMYDGWELQPMATVLRETAPRYRIRSDAPKVLSDALLLARLLRRSITRCATLLRHVGSWPGLRRLNTGDLQHQHGFRLHEAERLRIALELGRCVPFPSTLPTVIRSARDVADLVLPLEPTVQEQFWVVLLTTQHTVIAVETVYIGTIDCIAVRPADVFRTAIRRNAAAIVVAHAQPSGEPEPSPEDVQVTRVLLAAGQILNVPLLDHLIVGNNRWLSLREWQPSIWTSGVT